MKDFSLSWTGVSGVGGRVDPVSDSRGPRSARHMKYAASPISMAPTVLPTAMPAMAPVDRDDGALALIGQAPATFKFDDAAPVAAPLHDGRVEVNDDTVMAGTTITTEPEVDVRVTVLVTGTTLIDRIVLLVGGVVLVEGPVRVMTSVGKDIGRSA